MHCQVNGHKEQIFAEQHQHQEHPHCWLHVMGMLFSSGMNLNNLGHFSVKEYEMQIYIHAF